MIKRIRLAGIGCGGRTRTYMELAANMPAFYEVVAAADPKQARLEMTRAIARNPLFRTFKDDKALLAEPQLADVMIIGTQDSYHVDPCLAAMEKGYDILLEKPIATTVREILRLEAAAEKLGRKVLVCHVLRYAPFYRKVKDIVQSGLLGEIITLNASEGVGPWHQAHSYVRGHWGVTAKCTPMLVAKSCHDMDIISWLMDRPCISVSSQGQLTHFIAKHAPEGAPMRCTDGCPAGATCMYNAHNYLQMRAGWLLWVFDRAQTATRDEIVEWLKSSPWGRCVYHCDNDAVDHQIVSARFEGGATATFTMTAFDHGRNIQIFGTKGMLHGGHFFKHNAAAEIVVRSHDTGEKTLYSVNEAVGGYGHHGGGDPGLVLSLYEEMNKPNAKNMTTSLSQSVESHVIAFAAEEARVQNKLISLAEYRAAILRSSL